MTTAAICATRDVSWSQSFYSGEQYDSDLGLYYLRARYYNPATGRFLSHDPEDGNANDPASLHKYLYANGDPVNGFDPRGRMDLYDYASIALAVGTANYFVYTAFGKKVEESFICAQIAILLALTLKGAGGIVGGGLAGWVCSQLF